MCNKKGALNIAVSVLIAGSVFLLSFWSCGTPLSAARPQALPGTADTYTAAYGNVSVEKESKASLFYPSKTVIRYEGQDALYVSSSVKHGQRVEAGDLLMTVTPKIDPVETEEKELELARLKSNLEEETQLKSNEFSALEKRRDAVWWNYWEYQKLEFDLEKQRLDFEYDSACRSREIARKEKELQKLKAAGEAKEIRTPVSGIVTNMIFPEEGEVIPHNAFICFVEDPSSCRIKSPSCPFPFGSRVYITGSLNGEPVKTESTVTASSSVENIDTNQFSSYLTLPDGEVSWSSIQNLSIAGTVSELQNVLLVPTRAVHTDSDGDFVYLLTDRNKRQKQYIKARVINSDWTWVIRGLSEGQTIAFR